MPVKKTAKAVKKSIKKVAIKPVKAAVDSESEDEPEAPGSREYCSGYRGKELITEKTSPWNVLDIVRDAMRAEHHRSDWMRFYTEYKPLMDAPFLEKRALIARYAPSVSAKMKG